MIKAIYHGSNMEVPAPKLTKSDRALDFGIGFYTTENYEQAKDWAEKKFKRYGGQIVISKYEINTAELRIKEFKEIDSDWLDFICKCRSGINISFENEYDIISGSVANDTLFRIISFYEDGAYDYEYAIKRLKINPLYSQLCVCSETGISKLKYLGSEVGEYGENQNKSYDGI